MTERKPPGASFESWIERQIREAEERGEFDNLPGAGQPLPSRGGASDEMWWIKQKLEREGLSTEAVLPPPLQLRKEIERLPDTVRDLPSEDHVRAVVAELNTRIIEYIRTPSGPQIPVATVQADQVVAQWETAKAESAGVHGTPPAAEAGRPADSGAASEKPTPAQRPRRWWQRWRRSAA